MPDLYFTKHDVWTGGFFELAIELGNRSDTIADQRLYQALTAIWEHPSLDGCYLDYAQEPTMQTRIKPRINLIESGHKLFGIATLPNGYKVACGTMLFREGEGESDWLELHIPTGGLLDAYPIRAFPFNEDQDADRVWIVPLEVWFADIGKHVFSNTPFQLGIIGWEVWGTRYAKEVARDGISPQRGIGLLWPENGTVQYYPSNI